MTTKTNDVALLQTAPIVGLRGEGRVAREEGDGVIYGYVVATLGEARGHGFALDNTTLSQIVALGNSLPKGLKNRFKHPDPENPSKDGLGRFLGRSRNFRLSADSEYVLADLHLAKSSRATPYGDLGGYVLNLADEDPEAFGSSIAVRKSLEPRQGQLPALRILELRACDIVDDPAANPTGLFSAVHEPDQLAATAFDALLGDLDASAARSRGGELLDHYLSAKFPNDEGTMTKTTDANAAANDAAKLADLQKQLADQQAQLAARDQELKDREAKLAAEETQLKAKEARIAEEQKIRDTCLAAGSKNTDAYLSANLSLSEVKDKLIEEMTKSHSLSSLGAGSGNENSGGGEKPEERFRKEYREQQAVLSGMNVSEDDYIASRLQDGF